MGSIIRPIEKCAVHRICSGQVVLDLAAAVKELVENSLDAGATSIEVKLREYGAEAVEVADNGCGVSSENYQGLTLKYHTSKISDFADLQSLSSFGFRGEALSSLCALANVSILTRTQNEPTGDRIRYDHQGHIVSQEREARTVGTTVYVENLFKPLPVRHKEFTRNIRREYGRMLSILQAYALIAKDVRLLCTNQVGRKRSKVFSTQGKGSMKDNVVTVFGSKLLDCLEPLDTVISESLHVEGFVSKPGSGSGRGSGDRQYFFLNGRPVELPKVSKLLNEVYKSFNSQQYPVAIINLHLPAAAFDVNVTPDKRKVFLHSETELLEGLRKALGELYAPDKYTYFARTTEEQTEEIAAERVIDYETQRDVVEVDLTEEPDEETDLEGSCSRPEATADRIVDFLSFRCENSGVQGAADSRKQEIAAKSAAKSTAQRSLSSFIMKNCEKGAGSSEQPVLKRGRSVSLQALPVESKKKKDGSAGKDFTEAALVNLQKENKSVRHSESRCLTSELPVLKNCLALTGPRLSPVEDSTDSTELQDPALPRNDTTMPQEDGPLRCDVQLFEPLQNRAEHPIPNNDAPDNGAAADDAVVETADETVIYRIDEPTNHHVIAGDIAFDITDLRAKIKRGMILCRKEQSLKHNTRKSKYKAASVHGDITETTEKEKEQTLTAATRELEISFDKADFKRMKVLGQFNLGFILARLDDDIFIIDQHASDEKFNFERLSKSTVLNKQPLISPLPLDLSAAEEMTISAHLEIFRRTGFDFIEKDDAPPGRRLQLSAVPYSKNTVFGITDVQEMLSLLSDEFQSSHAQPSRVRAMLASRACRSSVMIGDALSTKEMEKIVFHLAELDAPWNCPHGRPTMRHLADLRKHR